MQKKKSKKNNTAGVTAGKLTAALASMVNPAVAVPAGAFFEILSYRSAKKTEDFLNDVEHRLFQLEKTGILVVNELSNEEGFIELLLNACRVLHHTQRKEKVARIKNAVIALSLESLAKSAEIDSFFHLFDQLTEQHFVILQYIEDFQRAFDSMHSFSDIFKHFSENIGTMDEDAFGHYLYDLKYRRLIRLSEKIRDNKGLAPGNNITFASQSDGAIVIVSEIAKQLIKYTKNSPVSYTHLTLPTIA